MHLIDATSLHVLSAPRRMRAHAGFSLVHVAVPAAQPPQQERVVRLLRRQPEHVHHAPAVKHFTAAGEGCAW